MWHSVEASYSAPTEAERSTDNNVDSCKWLTACQLKEQLGICCRGRRFSLWDLEVFHSLEHQAGFHVPQLLLAACFSFSAADVKDPHRKSWTSDILPTTLLPNAGSFPFPVLSEWKEKIFTVCPFTSNAAMRPSLSEGLQINSLGTVRGFKWSRLCIV